MPGISFLILDHTAQVSILKYTSGEVVEFTTDWRQFVVAIFDLHLLGWPRTIE